MASCGSQKEPVTVGREVQVKDSVVVTERTEVVFDTITIPEDSATIKALIRTLDERPRTVSSNNGRASVTLSRKRDTIYATANCELEERIVELENIMTEILHTKQRTEVITREVEVEYVPWYYRTLAWLGGIVLLILGISLGIKRLNPF